MPPGITLLSLSWSVHLHQSARIYSDTLSLDLKLRDISLSSENDVFSLGFICGASAGRPALISAPPLISFSSSWESSLLVSELGSGITTKVNIQ